MNSTKGLIQKRSKMTEFHISDWWSGSHISSFCFQFCASSTKNARIVTTKMVDQQQIKYIYIYEKQNALLFTKVPIRPIDWRYLSLTD